MQRESNTRYKIIVISAEKALNNEDRKAIENEKDRCQIGEFFLFSYFCNTLALQVFMWS